MRFPRCFHLSTLARTALILGLCGASLSAAHAQTRYHVTDLGTLPGRINSKPAALNNAGQVAGTADFLPFRYNGSPALEPLGLLVGGDVGSAQGINNAGQVVGDSNYTNSGAIRHAVLFNGNGTATDLGTLPLAGNYSIATAINASAQVVGYSGPKRSTSNTRAFLWDSTNGMRDIGTLGGGFAKAFGINDAGVVTGTASATAPNSFHAFLYTEAGGMRDLGTLAGSTSSGNFINASGHVVGTSTINDFDNREHAFFYDGVTMRDLGSLSEPDNFYSDRSFGYGINASDVVVGGTYLPYTGGGLYGVGFVVYRDGVMRDLNTLLDDASRDYLIGAAVSINDAGQIVANAVKISTNDLRAVLLTPNPVVRTVARATNGTVTLTGVGLPNKTHAIEATSDLAQPFTFLGNTVATANGTFEFHDSPESGARQRYYRAVYP